uniref:Thymus, brain and testes associated n=1 Tax=Salarias fasciatus TaxID=181472 RepID=A0A672I8X3_SALFA
MSTAQSPGPRGSTGERSHGHVDLVPLTANFTKMLTKGSARFGALSHHSFFSRHNPHPNRVKHIQGLNGRPICTVRDDWFVTSSLFPHPLLKGHTLRKAAAPFRFKSKVIVLLHYSTALFSEAWRDELKELVAKVNLVFQETQEDGFVRRQTQYSAETGRIIPPSSKSYHRKSYSQHLKYPQPFRDQELTVLEVLCQILQTDSLSTVQQWLLLAGQREKDLVMGMIRQALGGVDLSGRDLQHFQPYRAGASAPVCGSSFEQPWRKTRKTRSR